ncbi:MAG: hypothetical protein IJ752_07250 [Alphaproteobacteria bacterium]|nr:hypothetical protein [Alphaproteobacteria bacterium]
MGNLSSFYSQMTGKKLKEECHKPENEEKIKRLLGRDDIEHLSEIERAAALTAVQKISYMMEENIDLRNTNTLAQYHIVAVENKAANPLGFHASRISSLPEETQEQIRPHADKLLSVTHDGALWHEMTHTLGTDNESICEGFRFLKTLQKYKEPALLLPDFNARLYNNLFTLNTIRKDAVAGNRTLDGNFTYLMPGMIKYMMDNADSLGKELEGKSDAEIMAETQRIVKECSYPKETEKAFRNLVKNCEDEKALADKLRTVYENGADNPETGAVYPLVSDMFDVAKKLDSQATPETFFKPGNFAAQARNTGKEASKEEQNINLSEEEKKHYQELYDTLREQNPDKTGKEFDALFAQAIVTDAWAQKAKEEAKLDDQQQAAAILFDRKKSAEMTQNINALMNRARNAADIVKKYGLEFNKRHEKMKAAKSAAKESAPLQKRLNTSRKQNRRKSPKESALPQKKLMNILRKQKKSLMTILRIPDSKKSPTAQITANVKKGRTY